MELWDVSERQTSANPEKNADIRTLGAGIFQGNANMPSPKKWETGESLAWWIVIVIAWQIKSFRRSLKM